MPLFRRGQTAAVTPEVKRIRSRRPHAGMLRRERRALLAAREAKLRDLGGLMVEMYRRAAVREDLIQERCAEVIGIDARLIEIDELLHGSPGSARCQCGAPVLRGSHFCPNCGRVLDGSDGTGVSESTMLELPDEDR